MGAYLHVVGSSACVVVMQGIGKIRTFEIVQYISGPVSCEGMDDLPPNLQDAVYAALEKKSDEVELPLAIISVRCDKDLDSTDPTRVWFLHIVASEIVLGIDDSMRLLN